MSKIFLIVCWVGAFPLLAPAEFVLEKVVSSLVGCGSLPTYRNNCGTEVDTSEDEDSWDYTNACGEGQCVEPDPDEVCCQGVIMIPDEDPPDECSIWDEENCEWVTECDEGEECCPGKGCWNEDFDCMDCLVLSENSDENEDDCSLFFDHDLEDFEPVEELINPDGLNVLYQRVSYSIPRPGFTPFFVQGSDPPENVTTYLTKTYKRSDVSGCTDPAGGLYGKTTTNYVVASRTSCTVREGWTHDAPSSTEPVDSGQEPLRTWSIREFDNGDNTVEFRYDTELSESYSTADFIRDASAMMPNFQAGFSQISNSVSVLGVGLSMNTTEDWISYSKVRFKFEWGEDVEESEKTSKSYPIVFQPLDDPDTEDVNESENIEILPQVVEWDGSSDTVFELDPEALKPDAEGTFFLLKVDIVPDFDRDGEIGNQDRGHISELTPFRFWTNADADESADAMGSAPPEDREWSADDPITANGKDSVVNGYRDLVDFFTLSFDLQKILEVLPPADFEYRLSHADSRLRFFYTGLDPETVGDLHRKIYDPINHNPESLSFISQWNEAPTLEITDFDGENGGVVLEARFLETIKTYGAGILAFEGVPVPESPKESDAPLILHVIRKSDGQVLFEVDYPMVLSPVSNMYRTLNLRGSDDKFIRSSDADIAAWLSLVDLIAGLFGYGITENHQGRPNSLGEPSNLPDFYYSAAQPDSPYGLTFVHGYNWNGDEAGRGYDETFKRFFQCGMNAPFLGVFWRGDESQLGDDSRTTPDFPECEINALLTAPHLANSLPSEFKGGRSVIMAHSLGTEVVASAITEHGLDIGSAVLLNAASSREAFGHPVGGYPGEILQEARYMTAPGSVFSFDWEDFSYEPDGNGGYRYKSTNRALSTEWYRSFEGTGDDRADLTWRNKFTNFGGTQFYNYYSSGEQVLRNPVHSDGSEVSDARFVWGMLYRGGEGAWVYNQRNKGTIATGVATNDKHGGWGFNLAQSWDPRLTGSPRRHWMVTAEASDGTEYWTPMFPNQLDAAFASLTEAELSDRLVETPFFLPFAYSFDAGENAEDPDIFGTWGNGFWLYAPVGDPNASAKAADPRNQAKILAEAIPARSYAVGRNSVANLGFPANEFNFDMQELFLGTETGEWPERNLPDRWLHGDYLSPALCYVYSLYEDIVDQRELK